MKNIETIMVILIALILCFSAWFILSGEIWLFVSYLETELYPEIVAPE